MIKLKTNSNPNCSIARTSRIGRCIFLSLFIFCFWCTPVLASKDDCIGLKGNHSFFAGINRTNLGSAKNWRETLKKIAYSKIHDVRLTMNPPFEQSAEIVVFANSLGLRVLLNIPLGYPEFFDPGAYVREGLGKFFRQRRLSDLNVVRFRVALTKFLARLDEKKTPLYAIEVGNEINWTDFNGDLPLNEPGSVIGMQQFQTWDQRGHVEQGFQRYALVVAEVRKALSGTVENTQTKILAAGIVMPGAESVTHSGGSVLAIDVVDYLYRKLGIFDLVDGISVHSYPATNNDHSAQESLILQNLGRAIPKLCGGPGQKACWITEWGFRSNGNGCQVDDRKRAQTMQQFLTVAACFGSSIRGAYLYDWDQSPSYGIYRCGRVLESGKSIGANKQPPQAQ